MRMHGKDSDDGVVTFKRSASSLGVRIWDGSIGFASVGFLSSTGCIVGSRVEIVGKTPRLVDSRLSAVPS